MRSTKSTSNFGKETTKCDKQYKMRTKITIRIRFISFNLLSTKSHLHVTQIPKNHTDSLFPNTVCLGKNKNKINK